MRRVLLVGLVGALALTSAAVSARPTVTIVGIRGYRDPATHIELRVLAGRMSPARGGERVTVLEKECGAPEPYHVGGRIRTAADGTWVYRQLGRNTQYRARWRRARSRPFVLRFPLYLETETSAATPRMLTVETTTAGQDLTRRPVELQSRVTGPTGVRWVRIATARFRRAVPRTRFRAGLRLPVGELTLRVHVPATTAAPCDLPYSMEPFRAPSATPQVTIAASVASGGRGLVLSGSIPTRAAGQPILIWQRACGSGEHAWRSIVAFETGETTRTTAGGAWRWPYPDRRLDAPLSFRAAWGLAYSRSVLVRAPLETVVRRRGRVLRVVIDTTFTGQRLDRRVVELQRRAGSGWTRAGSAVLRAAGGRRYTAAFTIRPRQTLRVFVPATSAAPCYLATATRSVHS